MTIKVCVVLVAAVIVSLPDGTASQLATIPEQLAKAGRSLSSGASIPSGLAPTIDDILADTDLIVTGIVGEPRSYLSDDQMDVYTDYPILNPVVLYQSGVVASRVTNMPGIIATVVGGTVMIDGLTFTSTPEALPRLEPGSESLLLLKLRDDHYHLAGTYFGAFGISAGRLTPLTKKRGFASEYVNAAVPEAAKEFVGRRRRLHR